MKGFRLVALGYALLVLLIAPAWPAADEPPPTVSVPAVEETTDTVQETVDALPLDEAETVPDEANAPDVDPEPEPKAESKKASAAKDDKKKQPPAEEKEPAANAAATASVTIRDFEFAPATVTVNEGDTITWTNEGPTVHTATAEDGSFDTGSLRKGESGSATFTSAGTIAYICTPHPNMQGTVVVQAASAGSDGGAGGSSDGTGSTDDSGVAGDDAASTDSGSGLPDTGGEALSIALLGLATIGLGMLLRRRREET